MRILCGTDLLPKTESALERAGMLAELPGAELCLLHVALPTESDRMLEEDMQRAKELLHARVKSPSWRYRRPPNVEVRSGSPTQALIEAAQELDAGLVILGTHRRRLARGALVGTIAIRLLSALRCPVLIVRRMPFGPYRNVLMALDKSRTSAQIVRAAEALMIHAIARASVIPLSRGSHGTMKTLAELTGGWIGTDSGSSKRDAGAGVRDLLARVSNEPSRYQLICENDTTSVAAVTKIAEHLKPDLLILGAYGRAGHRAFLANTASRLMDVTGSDVLVVPPRETGGTWRRRRAERSALDVITGV